MLLDLKEEVKVTQFHGLLANHEIKDLFSLMQNYDAAGLIGAIQKSYQTLTKYRNSIPGSEPLLQSYDQTRQFLAATENRQDALALIYNTTKTDEFRALLKQLRKDVNQYKSWIKKYAALNRSNSTAETMTAPILSGTHYQAALEAAASLARLWFVEKVTLFGSVAKGREKPDSDVDIAVEYYTYFPKKDTVMRRYTDAEVGRVLDPLQEKYSKILKLKGKRIINVLNLSFSPKSNLRMYVIILKNNKEKTSFLQGSIKSG